MQRVEVITGKERRRQWTDDERRRLVAEAFAPGAIAAQVARRHDVAESCLFAWRKRFAAQQNSGQAEPQRLIPVMVDEGMASDSPARFEAATPARPRNAVITWPDGMRLEVPAAYPASALRSLVAALRRPR
ncbi:MAG: transposase [Alphaproteobacteria bacterium]|nr:transposase [Alphaproteobacteria bacterium]